jgi:glyceraldehyde 3-phosphate dehydrogenase
MKVGINGMGRIGRLALRAALGAPSARTTTRAGNRLEVVHLNEIKGGAEPPPTCCSSTPCRAAGAGTLPPRSDRIRINGQQLGFSQHATAAEIPWGDLGVDVVLECTGKFLTPETLQGHLDRGAKRVIVAAPVKVGDVLNIVVGVNHHLYDPAVHRIVTAASCTTNCLAPVVKVVHEAIGIRHGQITTHAQPDQHQPGGGCAAQGPAPRPQRHGQPGAHHHRQRHRHRADLPRAEGQAERPRGARAGAECVADRLRVRTEQRATTAEEVNALFAAAANPAPRWPASWATSRCRWSAPTTPATPAAASSMGCPPW